MTPAPEKGSTSAGPTTLAPLAPSGREVEVRLHQGGALNQALPRLEAYLLKDGPLVELSRHPGWMRALARGQRHVPYALEAVEGEVTRGFLALAYVDSLLFGRHLTSLPYLNYGGVLADDDQTANRLIDQAVALADRLGVRRLELRHEHPVPHPKLGHARTDKVQMRLDLPPTVEALEKGLDPKVRNQVKKGRKHNLTVTWGGAELLGDFYAIFARNMRDLGTPVYGRRLFEAILGEFPQRAEVCVVRDGAVAVASGLLLHGWGVTEVPSASSLRTHKHTNANMLMYFHLLARAIERDQDVFDFGRSTPDSGPYNFKRQWGAQPSSTEWQSYLRAGDINETRADNPKHQWKVRMWKRLPLWVANAAGPWIARGIP